MILCVCHNVSESTFRKGVQAGITNLGQACAQLKIGLDCGQCCLEAKRIIEEERQKKFAAPLSHTDPDKPT